MASKNEVVGMRLTPETLARIEEYNRQLMWKPGQLFTALLDAETRMQKAMEAFRPVVLDDGSGAIYYTDPTGEKDMLWGEDLEAPFHWFMSELQKPLTQRFLEPYFHWGDPRE